MLEGRTVNCCLCPARRHSRFQHFAYLALLSTLLCSCFPFCFCRLLLKNLFSPYYLVAYFSWEIPSGKQAPKLGRIDELEEKYTLEIEFVLGCELGVRGGSLVRHGIILGMTTGLKRKECSITKQVSKLPESLFVYAYVRVLRSP